MYTIYSNPKASDINQESIAATLNASISDTPYDMISEVIAGNPLNPTSTGFLTAEEQGYLSSTSSRMFKVTQPSRDARILQKFLLCVAHGEQDKAEKLLKVSRDKSKWLLGVYEVTDYSNRTFKTATAFEYAYWAKDAHMCSMLMRYMDKQAADVIKKRIEVSNKKGGLVYEQNGTLHQSKHFNFAPLKMALIAYIAWADRWFANGEYAAMQDAWMLVGQMQRDVPAHVANEYCRPDRSFSADNVFDESTLPRMLTYRNCLGTYESWFSSRTSRVDLGIALDAPDSFGIAIIRHHRKEASGIPATWVDDRNNRVGLTSASVAVDFEAIERLDRMRTSKLHNLVFSYSESDELDSESDSDFCTSNSRD